MISLLVPSFFLPSRVPFEKINLSSANKERKEKNTVHGAKVKKVCSIIDRQGKKQIKKRAIIIDIVTALRFNSSYVYK